MVNYLYRPITNVRQYSKNRRKYSDIKFIVIHDTANTGRGAGAMNHYKYLNNARRYGSAHYYVDDKEIVQTIGDSRIAWHCGDTWAKKRATRRDVSNLNSIGIEICINSDGDYDTAVFNAIELVKNLMIKFNIPVDRVVRHFDASGKTCPQSMSSDDWDRWNKFKEEIKKPRVLKIDLDKDSVAERIGEKKEKGDSMNQEKPLTRFESKNGLDMIITTPENIYQQHIGKTIRATGAYGINGTFFDTKRPEDPESCWQICVNNGEAISENAKFNSYKGVKKGTFIIDEDGKVYVERLASVDGFKKTKIKFAVGGVELLPNYDPKAEQTARDILRYTWHTAIGFKADTSELYLITTSSRCDMNNFKERIKSVGITHAVALDGGGSTQMFYKNRGLHQNRKVCTMIGLRKI